MPGRWFQLLCRGGSERPFIHTCDYASLGSFYCKDIFGKRLGGLREGGTRMSQRILVLGRMNIWRPSSWSGLGDHSDPATNNVWVTWYRIPFGGGESHWPGRSPFCLERLKLQGGWSHQDRVKWGGGSFQEGSWVVEPNCVVGGGGGKHHVSVCPRSAALWELPGLTKAWCAEATSMWTE